MQEEKCFLQFRIDVDPVIQILQLKFLIRFAEALFKPKDNSSEKLYTVESIRDITVGQLENLGVNTPIHGKVHIKVMQSLQLNILHQTTYSSCFKVI